MRQMGLIIGKGKMRRIRCLEILWLDTGLAPRANAVSMIISKKVWVPDSLSLE
jgi:hypothetical protein